MAERKVINFRANSPLAMQADLFEYSSRFARRYTFIDIEEIDQQTLGRLIEAGIVTGIMDLRAFPVFRAPRFNHGDVFDLMSRYDVVYVPLLESLPQSARASVLASGISKLKDGLFLILFDRKVDSTLILATRQRLNEFGYAFELPARFLKV